jgi:tripartite-type tricarboxylate transporter receptor subunit TctC
VAAKLGDYGVKTRYFIPLLAALGLSGVCGTAYAQTWPTKPIRVVITFAPGGSSDIVARLLSAPLQEKLGQTIIVDNRPGGGGTIGADIVAKAVPDGYTLLLSNSSPISLSPFMLSAPPYDPMKSFTHVSYIGSVANVFVLHPSVPARNFAEMIAWIRTQPNAVNYGSGGIGSIGHIVGETMKNDLGLKMEHIGYRGSAPMHLDLFSGTLKMAIDTLTQNVPLIKDGRLRAIAVTSPTRAALAGEIPSVLEVGQKKLVAENFLGISGPAGLPKAVVDRINSVMAQVLSDSNMIKRLEDLGISGRTMSSAEFTKFVRAQVTEWGPAVRASGAKLN